MYQVPSVVVTLVNTNPAPVLVTVTLAPGTIAPVVSVTAPTIVAVPVEDWAASVAASSADESRKRMNMGPPSVRAMLSRARQVVKTRCHRLADATRCHPLAAGETRPLRRDTITPSHLEG